MATLPELLAQAEIIRTAQNVDENTAERIGKLYNDIIVYFSNNGGSGGTIRSYTIDFNTYSELAQDSNLLGEITIDRILTKNVTELYVSYGSVVRQQVPTSGTVSLSIPDETVLVWEIVRATEGELACVGIRFEILMEE